MLMSFRDFQTSDGARSMLAATGKPDGPAADRAKYRLLVALAEREAQGLVTRLRDVGRLVNLPHHRAFRLLRALEFGGLLRIGVCLRDASAAEVRLTPGTADRLGEFLAAK